MLITNFVISFNSDAVITSVRGRWVCAGPVSSLSGYIAWAFICAGLRASRPWTVVCPATVNTFMKIKEII